MTQKEFQRAKGLVGKIEEFDCTVKNKQHLRLSIGAGAHTFFITTKSQKKDEYDYMQPCIQLDKQTIDTIKDKIMGYRNALITELAGYGIKIDDWASEGKDE